MSSYKIITILFLSILCGCAENPTPFIQQHKESLQPNKSADTMVAYNEKEKIPCEIIWKSDSKRYDHAPTIIVITDSNSHKRMHDLTDQFARKKSSKKFTLIVLDDRDAGLVYKASHYGANEVNRIATKVELRLMDDHTVGTYIGELEANGDPYEIMYHGFGYKKETHEEYEPNFN